MNARVSMRHEVLGSQDGIWMGRAFREGIENSKRIETRVKQRRWLPLEDLQGLATRAESSRTAVDDLANIPAMFRIEGDDWVFEEISEEMYSYLTHKLIVRRADSNDLTIGATTALTTAIAVAAKMAAHEDKCVLIQAM